MRGGGVAALARRSLTGFHAYGGMIRLRICFSCPASRMFRLPRVQCRAMMPAATPGDDGQENAAASPHDAGQIGCRPGTTPGQPARCWRAGRGHGRPTRHPRRGRTARCRHPRTPPPPRTHGLEARVENTTCFLTAPRRSTSCVAPRPVSDRSTRAARRGDRAREHSSRWSRRPGASAASRPRRTAATTKPCSTSVAVRADGLRGGGVPARRHGAGRSYLPADDPLRIVVARFAVAANGRSPTTRGTCF